MCHNMKGLTMSSRVLVAVLLLVVVVALWCCTCRFSVALHEFFFPSRGRKKENDLFLEILSHLSNPTITLKTYVTAPELHNKNNNSNNTNNIKNCNNNDNNHGNSHNDDDDISRCKM